MPAPIAALHCSATTMSAFDHKTIDAKWQARWDPHWYFAAHR
jgi:hypothetical protein